MPLLNPETRLAFLNYADAQIQKEIHSRTIENCEFQRLEHSEQRKERNDGAHFILRKLLELNLNNPLHDCSFIDNFTQEEQQAYLALYVECTLVRAFPEIFHWNSNSYLDVKDSAVNKELIRAGLGFDLRQERNQAELTLGQFRYPVLQDLYLKDGNILWVILQSVKPVTDEFTRNDKINCYIELAHAFYRDSAPYIYKQAQILIGLRSQTNTLSQCIMTPGLDKAFKGALEMAHCAYAIAVDHNDSIKAVNDAFFPENKNGFWAKISNIDFTTRFATWFSMYESQVDWENECRSIENTVHGLSSMPSLNATPR